MGENTAEGSQRTLRPSWVPEDESLERLFASDSFAALADLDEADQRFEIIVREQIVQRDLVPPAGIEALERALKLYCVDHPGTNDRAAFTLFFLCFEWHHRLTNDKVVRSAKWRRLFRMADGCFDAFALFHYAQSVRLRYDGQGAEAAVQARVASEKAPDHVGLLNNYAEIVLDEKEREILSLEDGDYRARDAAPEAAEGMRAPFDSTELRAIANAFAELQVEQDFCTFHINLGRIWACLGDYDEAREELDRATDLATKQFEEKAESPLEAERLHCESEYVQLMAWISTSSNTCYQIENIRAMRTEVEQSQTAMRSLIDELSAKNADVERRLSDERINMVEMLAFFSGIISLIVVSTQVGEDLDFMPRSFLIMVMSGSLLIVFGALAALLEAKRSDATHPTGRMSAAAAAFSGGGAVVIGVGAVLIALGVVLSFAF